MARIYLDSIATTMPDPQVVEEVAKALRETWADPSSTHGPGKEAKEALEEARTTTASFLGAKSDDLILTSGATEANAMVLSTVSAPGARIITTSVEPTGLARALAANQGDVVQIPVDETGMPDLEALSAALEDGADLVSMTYGHPILGGLLPLGHVGRICQRRQVPLHIDARQAVGWLPIEIADEPIDMLSFSAHHLHGPPGIGGLWVRPGAELTPLIPGGPQERGRRAGREAVPLAIGMAKAMALAEAHLMEGEDLVANVATALYHRIDDELEEVLLFGPSEGRLPGHLALSIAGVEGTTLAAALDAKGIQVAPVHQGLDTVLQRLGVDEVDAIGTICLRVSRLTTPAEITTFTKEFLDSVGRLRAASPFW